MHGRRPYFEHAARVRDGLRAQFVDGEPGHAFFWRPGQPKSQRGSGPLLLVERRQADDTLQIVPPMHGVGLSRCDQAGT